MNIAGATVKRTRMRSIEGGERKHRSMVHLTAEVVVKEFFQKNAKPT